jgi:hypothetical protein
MVVKEAYTPLERYCHGSNCRNDATEIGWSLIHFSTNSYVESFPPSRGIKEVGGNAILDVIHVGVADSYIIIILKLL